jgi:hypothetical protein
MPHGVIAVRPRLPLLIAGFLSFLSSVWLTDRAAPPAPQEVRA